MWWYDKRGNGKKNEQDLKKNEERSLKKVSKNKYKNLVGRGSR
nr:MAG TPA: hypothetical protein [Caudoviricetes sp.]